VPHGRKEAPGGVDLTEPVAWRRKLICANGAGIGLECRSVSGELGLRRFFEERGHAFVVTSDKDGPNSVFERELVDAAIVISQPL